MLLLTNEVQEVQMFFVLVQYVINQLLWFQPITS